VTQSILYALPTKQCNLTCAHCDVKNVVDDYNEEAFLGAIRKFDGSIVLFGGEPSLYKERLLKAVATGKINSITTNLINLDDELIQIYKDLFVGTSWNKVRFFGNQFSLWLSNLKKLEENEIVCTVLITLTGELINDDIENFFSLIKNLDENYKAVDSILFEQIIDGNKTKEFYEQVDEWLCKIHELWQNYDIKIENSIIGKLKHWNHDCTQTYTLHPNGRMAHGCPHAASIHVAHECLTCPRVGECRPCRLQQHCTYPQKLAQLVAEKTKRANKNV
jgi:MoaA/NifB/PqqE/SkfB family radical SAM enzyme